MLKVKTLGIYDSGLGGYSVYHDLKQTYPDFDMIMFADQVNAPYGNKSSEEIRIIAFEAMFRFQRQGITSVLIACNTVSAVALDYLRENFPDMNIWGIIDLTVSQIPSNHSVGVVATQATVDSKAYILAMPDNTVEQMALYDLVRNIESLSSDEVLEESLLSGSVYDQEYLILGCTHFPLVKHLFANISDAIIVDSRIPIRKFLESVYLPGSGTHEVYTSGDPRLMEEQIKQLFNETEEVKSWNSSF